MGEKIMKIMWICNILLKDFANAINQKAYYGGGWMEALAQDLCINNNLIICGPYKGNTIKNLKKRKYNLLCFS